MVRLAKGIGWLHDRGYVHRDIHLGNIFFLKKEEIERVVSFCIYTIQLFIVIVKPQFLPDSLVKLEFIFCSATV